MEKKSLINSKGPEAEEFWLMKSTSSLLKGWAPHIK